MKIVLLANSSSGDPYEVEFLADAASVRVFCHCQAGTLQMMCKHKLALIKGDAKMLYDAKQATLLDQVQSWPQFAKLRPRLDEYQKQLNEIEVAKGELAKKEKAIKAQFAHGLCFGFH
jgi:hypothetical protein